MTDKFSFAGWIIHLPTNSISNKVATFVTNLPMFLYVTNISNGIKNAKGIPWDGHPGRLHIKTVTCI